MFSFWIVTGQLLTQHDPPYLPLSRDGCVVPNTTMMTPTTMVTHMVTQSASATETSIFATTAQNSQYYNVTMDEEVSSTT